MTTDDLNTLVGRMRVVLTKTLAPTAGTTAETEEDAAIAAEIAIAPWYNETDGKHNLAYYVGLAGGTLGIDQVVQQAGYTSTVINALVDMINGQSDAIDGLTRYSANCCYNNARRGIVFAPKLPIGDGVTPTSMENAFRDCRSLQMIDSEIDWSNVTSLSYAFYASTIIPTSEITLNIPLCTTIDHFGGNFRKITFVNMRNVSDASQFLFSTTYTEEIEGYNCSKMSTVNLPLPKQLKVLKFDGLSIKTTDGTNQWVGGSAFKCDAIDANAVNFVRSGAVFGKNVSTTCQIASLSDLNEESLLALVYTAYDWTNNPLGLALTDKPDTALLTYDFTNTQKSNLAAYISKMGWSIDPQEIMETKGWSY